MEPLARPWRVRMAGRAVDEAHRASTELELLFDLTFVVAVSRITSALAHTIAEGHLDGGLVGYLEVFFAVWWAWMNFTWFASSYDTDDVPYRLLTFVQMGGVLVLAAGIGPAIGGDLRAVTVGYAVMRIGLVAQWLRAAASDPERRGTARRYAVGIVVLQVLWFGRLVVAEHDLLGDDALDVVFLALALGELAVPWWAERRAPTNWHPHHIAERYGLFTIILLGECVLSVSSGIDAAVEGGVATSAFATIAVAGLVLLFTVWWLAFLRPSGPGLARHRERSFVWGYGHYAFFASLSALGAGLEVAVERTGHELPAGPVAVAYAIGVPSALLLVLLGALTTVAGAPLPIRPPVLALAVVVVLAVPAAAGGIGVPAVVVVIAATAAALVALGAALDARAAAGHAPAAAPADA